MLSLTLEREERGEEAVDYYTKYKFIFRYLINNKHEIVVSTITPGKHSIKWPK